MVDTPQAEVREPPSARERRAFVRMGLWAVIAVAVTMTLAAAFVLAHRPHTPQITPGVKQSSPVASVLDRLQVG